MAHPDFPEEDHTPGPSDLPTPGAIPTWEQFATDHAEWLAGFPSLDDPLYALPAGFIRELKLLNRLDDRARDAELAFEFLCRAAGAVGFAGGRPIASDLVSLEPRPNPRKKPNARKRKKVARKPVTRRRRVPRFTFQDRREMAARHRGYAGWLLTDPDFLRTRDTIKEKWKLLPETVAPPFPLRRWPAVAELAGASSAGSGSPPASIATAGFRSAFLVFCDRWGLAGMITWDFPEPLEPTFLGRPPDGPPAQSPAGLYVFIPFHFPLTGDDDILHRIQERRRKLAAGTGLDPSAVGLGHFKAYATIFEVLHWEGVIRGRCAASRRIRQLIAPMEEMIGGQVGIESGQVRKLRNAIKACRRGKRGGVAALKPRP